MGKDVNDVDGRKGCEAPSLFGLSLSSLLFFSKYLVGYEFPAMAALHIIRSGGCALSTAKPKATKSGICSAPSLFRTAQPT